MNVFQVTQQLVAALTPANFKWPTGAQEAVFGRVAVDPAPPDFFHADLVSPAALVHVEVGRDHEEVPADLVEEARWTIFLFGSNATDQVGGSAVVGGNRSDLGSSRGRGLLEVEQLVKGAIFDALGLTARPRTTGAQPTNAAGRMNGVVAERALEVVATRIPSYPDYAPVNGLKGSGAGGNAALTWFAAPARYDLVGYTWVRVAGSTPATTPTGGTFVADPSATGLNDAPGAGTWSYSIFWAYDQTLDPATGNGAAAPNAWSSVQTAQAGLAYKPASVTVAV